MGKQILNRWEAADPDASGIGSADESLAGIDAVVGEADTGPSPTVFRNIRSAKIRWLRVGDRRRDASGRRLELDLLGHI